MVGSCSLLVVNVSTDCIQNLKIKENQFLVLCNKLKQLSRGNNNQ